MVPSSFSFLYVTRLGTFVRVARIAVRGLRVLIFRGCDHLSDTTTAVERHSLPSGGYGPRDNAISLDYLRCAYMHYNAREILKRSCNFRSVNLYVCDKRDHIRDHCLMIECLLYFYAMRRKLLIDRYVTLREKQTLRVGDYNSKYLFLHVKQVSIDRS